VRFEAVVGVPVSEIHDRRGPDPRLRGFGGFTMLSPLLSRKKKEGMLSEQVVELRNHRMVVGNGLRSRPGRAMTNAVENFWDSLSKDAADSAQAILDKLKDKAWSSPLVASIRDNGGITRANKDRMFELRFGYALDQVGIVPEYEIRGEGQSTIDFRLHERRPTLARGNGPSQRDAGGEGCDLAKGGRRRHSLERPHPAHLRQRPQAVAGGGETLKAVEKICQKCESKGRPHKFPAPDGAYHAMLVDFRTFMNGGDIHDRIHVALGADAVARQYRLFWNQRPITGVFGNETKVRGAAQVRERVQFLGFVGERVYGPGEFAAATQFIANPHLFANAPAARAAMAAWPLQPTHLINGGD
jgi:hypothetical protein